MFTICSTCFAIGSFFCCVDCCVDFSLLCSACFHGHSNPLLHLPSIQCIQSLLGWLSGNFSPNSQFSFLHTFFWWQNMQSSLLHLAFSCQRHFFLFSTFLCPSSFFLVSSSTFLSFSPSFISFSSRFFILSISSLSLPQ